MSATDDSGTLLLRNMPAVVYELGLKLLRTWGSLIEGPQGKMYPMSTIYTVKDVCGRTGLTYKQVDDLAREGLVAPSVAAAGGKGTRRLYGDQDLVVLSVAAQLREVGIGRSVFRKVIKILQSRRLKPKDSNVYLVASADKVVIVSTAELTALLRVVSRLTFVLPLFRFDETNP